MPEISAMSSPTPNTKSPKLFRSDPDLPPAVSGVADVLQDGVEALLRVVDTKVNWVMPNQWVWLPGDYEWSESTEEGKTPSITTTYKLRLCDDNSCEYTWNRVEQTKKKTEHSMIMHGVWKQPEKRQVPAEPSADGTPAPVEPEPAPAGGEGGDEAPPSRPATAASSRGEEAVILRVLDALAIVPNKISFERHTTGSTGKTVTIATKAGTLGAKPKPKPKPGEPKPKVERQYLRVASEEEWPAVSAAIDAGEKDAELCIAPFELVFEILPNGELVRADTKTAAVVFPSGPTSIALAGITAKAMARLGEPHAIITDGWVPASDGSKPLMPKNSAPFSPLDWLALYLKTHSPSYERHIARQQDCGSWLSSAAAAARKAEIEAELAVIAAALAAKQKEAHDWLLAKAMVALEIMRKEDEEDEAEDDDDE